MKQQLTVEESRESRPIGIHFHFFLDKNSLLSLLNHPIAAGIRISFGEQNGQRNFITTAANSDDQDAEDLTYVNAEIAESELMIDNFSEASKIKSLPVNFFHTDHAAMMASNTTFHPVAGTFGAPPAGFIGSSPTAWFNKSDIMDLLNVDTCVGLRVFPGTAGLVANSFAKVALMPGVSDPSDDPEVLSHFPTLIMIGVDANGKDLGTTNPEFVNNPYVLSLLPCPPKCGTGDTAAPMEEEES